MTSERLKSISPVSDKVLDRYVCMSDMDISLQNLRNQNTPSQ